MFKGHMHAQQLAWALACTCDAWECSIQCPTPELCEAPAAQQQEG